MEVSGGWQFWLEDHGRVRQFMVAEADEIKARKVLREKLQDKKILSRKMVPRDIIQMLNMKPGELSEWVSADETSVVPTPRRGRGNHAGRLP
jgi:hypothetical protein